MGKKSKTAESSRKEILQLYDGGFSRKAIAKRFNISDGPVLRIIKNSNKKIRGHQDLKNLCNIKLTAEEEAVLFGTLLGDGHITSRALDTATITWSYAKESYAEFLNHKLKRLCNRIFPRKYSSYICPICRKQISKNKNVSKCPKCNIPMKSSEKWRFQTKTLLSLKKLENIIVKEGRKTISYEWLKQLTSLSLAIWYMDDGWRHRGSMWFCTEGFNYSEHKILQNYLEKKWNVKTLLRRSPSQTRYNLRVDVDSIDDFISLIESYIPDCMKYKLPSKLKPLVCSWCGEEFSVSRKNYGRHITHTSSCCFKPQCKKLACNFSCYKWRMKREQQEALDFNKWKLSNRRRINAKIL